MSDTRRLIFDQRERVGDWAKSRIANINTWGDSYNAIGCEKDGELIAACIFNNYTGWDIEVHLASNGSRLWMPRKGLYACFHYPFIQLGCLRMTGCVASKNEASRNIAEHLGFRLEGVKRHAVPDDDLCIYGILRSECRYL